MKTFLLSLILISIPISMIAQASNSQKDIRHSSISQSETEDIPLTIGIPIQFELNAKFTSIIGLVITMFANVNKEHALTLQVGDLH